MKEEEKTSSADSSFRLYLEDVYPNELLEIKVQPGSSSTTTTTIGDILKMVNELLLSGEETPHPPTMKRTLGYEGVMLDEGQTLAFYNIESEAILDFIEYEEDEEWTNINSATGQKSHSDIEKRIEDLFLEVTCGELKFQVPVELMPKFSATKMMGATDYWSPA